MEEQGHYLTRFQRKLLIKRLQTASCPKYRRRIQIMLLADEGKSQTQICTELKCSARTASYWMLVAQTGKAHELGKHPFGRPKTVTTDYQVRLEELARSSPRQHGYPFEQWTGRWLSKHLATEFGIVVSERHINRLLKEMGLSTRQTSCLKRQGETKLTERVSIKIQDLEASPLDDSLLELQMLQIPANH